MAEHNPRDLATIIATLGVTFFVGMRFGETNIPDQPGQVGPIRSLPLMPGNGGTLPQPGTPVGARYIPSPPSQNFQPQNVMPAAFPSGQSDQSGVGAMQGVPIPFGEGTTVLKAGNIEFQSGLIELLISRGEKVQAKQLIDGYRKFPEVVAQYGAMLDQLEKQTQN